MQLANLIRPLAAAVLIGLAFQSQIRELAAENPAWSIASESLEEFTVGQGGRPLLIPVTLDGRNFPFLVDTGTSKTILDTSLESYLGALNNPAVLKTSAGFVSSEVFDCPDASVGSLNLDRVGTVGCMDLRAIRYATGKEVMGILDMDFLGDFAIEIDFDNGFLRLWSEAPPEWNGRGEEFPMVLARDCLLCDAGMPWPRIA